MKGLSVWSRKNGEKTSEKPSAGPSHGETWKCHYENVTVVKPTFQLWNESKSSLIEGIAIHAHNTENYSLRMQPVRKLAEGRANTGPR